MKAGETFEKAANIFQKSAGATGEALHGLEDSFASLYLKSSASGEALAGALSQLTVRTGATGEALENLATSFGKLTKVVGGDLNENITTSEKLFKQWGVSVDEQKGKLDELVVVAQKTAIPFQTLAQEMTAFGPILRNMGFNFEQSAALLGKFDLSGIGTQQVMRTLGQGLAELSKNFADPEAALRLLIERMAAAPSTTQALQVAMSEGLGKKGALALADAIHQGAFAIDDLVKAAQNSEGTIDDVASRTQTLSGQWTKFQHAIEAAIAPLGKDLIGALSTALAAMKPVTEMLSGLIKWFETLPGPIKLTVEALAGIVAVAPGVALAIKGVATAWEALGLASAVGNIKSIATALTSDLVPALTSGQAMLLKFGAAGVAIGGIVLAVGAVRDIFKDLNDLLPETSDEIDKLNKVYGGLNSTLSDNAKQAKLVSDFSKGWQQTWETFNWKSMLLGPLGGVRDLLADLNLYFGRMTDSFVTMATGLSGALGRVTAANDALNHKMAEAAGGFKTTADASGTAQHAAEALRAEYAAGTITQQQYRTALDALSKGLAPSADAMAKAAQIAAEWNDKWAESAKRALDSVSDAASGDTSAEQAFSKLNAVIETGSINFDKLSATGVKTLLAVMAAANDMRKAIVDAANNEALDQITEQLANLQIKASELADKVPLDFKDMMAGVTQGVNFTGLEKQLQTTIDDLKAKLATAGPAFASSLQLVIDKSQGALDGLRSMTAALALIGQDKSMEELAAHIDGLIVEQNKGQLSGEQWQAGLNGVSDALLKKIIPAMEQGLPISQALVNELAKIPGIGPQLAAAAGQGFDTFNNAVKNWAETTRASVLTVDNAFKDLGVTSLDAASQSMTRNGNDIIAVLKKVNDSTALTSAQFVADQAAVIAWGEKVLPPMVEFGQTVSDDVLAQIAKISPALAKAAKDGPDAFNAALEALKTKALISTMSLEQAFHELGIKSSQDLNNAADVASAAYQKIADSGTASANTQRDALVKALEAEKAAYIAAGADLPAEQQKTLDKLLNQQSYFNQQHQDQWHSLYLNIDAQIMSLSDKLVQDLFEGNGSFGKTALKALEDIGAAVVSAFIAPATKAIANFIAGSIADLMGKTGFGGLSTVITDCWSSMGKGIKDAVDGIGVLDKSIATTSDDLTKLGSIGAPSAGGAGDAGSAAGGAGDAGGAASAIGDSLTGWLGAIGSVATAISSIVSNFQMAHMETSLNAIEHNTRYSMMYLGERADGGILGVLFSVHDTLAFGTITKKIEALSNEFTMHYADTSITKLTEISSNTFWSMKKLDEINSKTGKAATSSSVNVEGTDLTTVITALDNINTTLQFSVGLSPWFQTAFQNINNGIVACSGWLQDIAGNLKSGISTTGGGSTNLASDAFGSLAGFVGTEFSTLYAWLGAALKPLLTQQGGQGLTVAPGLPGLPTFTSSTGSSVAAASGATVDLTSLETYLSAQFASVTAGLVSLGGTISTQLAKLGEVTGEIFSNSVGLIVATLKASDQLTAAGMERLLKQDAALSALSTAALGGIGGTLGHLTDITASDFQQLIAATKLTVSVPDVNAPHALVGVGAGVSNITSSSQSTTTNTFHFHNPRITSVKEATDILNIGVQELRRRRRSVG